jgi:hypothetical protein
MDLVVIDFSNFGTIHTKFDTVYIKFSTVYLKFDKKLNLIMSNFPPIFKHSLPLARGHRSHEADLRPTAED